MSEGKQIDLTKQKLIAMRDVQGALAANAKQILICENCVVTPSARDFLSQHNIALVKNGAAKPVAKPSGQPVSRNAANPKLFTSPEAEAIKKEICHIGKKLWMRQYVDGNGGNISYRIGPNEVICTPTLMSKYDLTPEDLCMVDLEGNQIAGTRARTSEILLHLEIYKAVPEAKSCVHCHPPHATAYAIVGEVPPNLIIPEFEVFVGKVAIAPYETPGTAAFAKTILPYVKNHNTLLLSNHGIICWADTVTHAEWYAEVLETYCWTLTNAAQLGTPISHISEQKGLDLLALKKKLGLPDARFETSKSASSTATCPPSNACTTSGQTDPKLESLVSSVTDAVMKVLGSK
jgi:L-fuculose-phosphate aldolase